MAWRGVVALTIGVWLLLAAGALGQGCEPHWLKGVFGFPGPGVNNYAASAATFDDGTGEALYVVGPFTRTASGPARGIAKWDGTEWSEVGSGLGEPGPGVNPGYGRAMLVFDDGSGPALYVGGTFKSAGGAPITYLARWTGSEWQQVGGGVNNHVNAMCVHDDGSGPALYVAGNLTEAGGAQVSLIAKWDGMAWSSLGADKFDFGPVESLCSYDDGAGAALIAGGWFIKVGSLNVSRIAAWRNGNWSALGAGVTTSFGDTSVRSLVTRSEQGKNVLYAGGQFDKASGKKAWNIAKWDGQTWSSLAGGVGRTPTDSSGAVYSMATCDLDDGERLIVSGFFGVAGQVPAKNYAVWDGDVWQVADGAPDGGSLCIRGKGPGGSLPLVFAGLFSAAGQTPLNRVALWDGETCTPMGPVAAKQGLNGGVDTLHVSTVGGAARLYVGGGFTQAGPGLVRSIAAWDGRAWSPLGSGVDGAVWALATFDDGTGPRLYAGGSFETAGGVAATNIASWDGMNWEALGTDKLSGGVNDMRVFDDGGGPALYVAGYFSTIGEADAKAIAKWDGQRWTPLHAGTNFVEGVALEAFDDGGGARLYMSATIPGNQSETLFRWTGSSWIGIDAGVEGKARALLSTGASADGLVVGGIDGPAGGDPFGGIARWDGGSWAPLGTGLQEHSPYYFAPAVDALVANDDGVGPAVVTAGYFDTAGGAPASMIAKWEGDSWSAMAGGLDEQVGALAVLPGEGGDTLFAGGRFLLADGAESEHIAAWVGCPKACKADCDGSGELDIDDFICFQTLFAVGDAKADCDGSGELDIDDFICFQTAFGVGCG